KGRITPLALGERLYRVEAAIGRALLGRDHVRLRTEIVELYRRAEVHVDRMLARGEGVHPELAEDALPHAEREDGDHVRPRGAERDATDAGLRGEERVRIRALVARALGMDPEHRADVLPVQLLDAARDDVLIEG